MYTQLLPTTQSTSTNLQVHGRFRTWVNNISLVFIGLIAGLVLSEVVLAFLKPPPIHWYYPQPLHLPDKQLGWVMTPNQHSYTHDKPVSTNSLGLRGPEISIAKPAGALRVLCLGDSQTFGNGVMEADTYSARLQALLQSQLPGRPIQVINAGVAGYDTVQEVNQLARIAPVIKPDIVTVGFYLNDIVEVTQSKDRYIISAASGEFKRTGLLKQFTPYRLIYLLKRSRLITFLYSQYGTRRMTAEGNIINSILLGRTPPSLERAWPIIETALERAETMGKTDGYRMIVFPIPAVQEFLSDYPLEQYHSRFMSVARKLGLDRFDPTPEMKRGGGGLDKYFIQWDGHINPLTHDLIARRLAAKIVSQLTTSNARQS